MAEKPTQAFLDFETVKDGLIILRNKGLRAVLMVSSLNFALKSEDEQNATIYQFQNFLNSLDFPTQILVSSRRLNIAGYLEKIKHIEKEETNELLKIQIGDYHKFVSQILEGGSVMQKSFYVIIPFSPTEGMGASAAKKIKGKLSEEDFKRCKTQIMQRVEFAILGLKSAGLDTIPLTTLELIELLWSFHHPREAERGYYPQFLPDLFSKEENENTGQIS